ncbi:hypothetical protein ACELLULO517_14620 [Acidisoma cellulosilytica]|uniref:General secretion pathway protein M n=1 Tax=Acidisoma cellulosilyticum TaxID=2802395 RepID=A0A963Z2M0_9PROT|nr:type II secretion system protein GspM [Acidisoma cellulosilyticum]MCB8881481.1 hypothetical protein [Acidisoma cellulosilyticum]
MLALLILLLALTLAWKAVVQPIIDMATSRQKEIEAMSDRLTQLRAIVARIPALRANADALRERLEAEGGVWTGTNETVVATSMQSKIRDVVTGRGGKIRSTSELNGTDEAGLRLVLVHVVIDGTLDTVVQTLASIATSRPPIFVENMTITAPTHSAPTQVPMLSLDLDVLGYMRKSAQ